MFLAFSPFSKHRFMRVDRTPPCARRRGAYPTRAAASGTNQLRLGVLSNFLYEHSIGKMMVPLFASLPDTMEVHVIDGLGLDCPHHDHVHRFIISRAKSYTQISDANFEASLHTVAALDLDLLLFPDIGMEPFTFFLSFARLAPIQVSV